VFQPGLRANDITGGGSVALAPAIGFAPPRIRSRVAVPTDFDLVVDLGRDIGSAHWWRGAATVLLLCGAATWLGGTIRPLPVPADQAYTPAQQLEAQPQAIAPLALGSSTGKRVAANGQLVRPLSQTPERPRIERSVSIGGGTGLAAALRRAGASEEDAKTVADLVGSAVPLNSIDRGTSADLVLGRRANTSVPRPLESMAFRAAFDLKLAINRVGGELKLKRIPIAVDSTPMHISGAVGGSLYKSARAAGVPANLVAEFIKVLSFSVDFQHDVPSSAKFDLIFEHRLAETGETRIGRLLYAGLDMNGKKLGMMRWTLGGREQFFDASGQATQKGLLRTPVDGARITSSFGMRFHPVLGYSRMHKGVDFGVPYGSPIVAAAAGKVVYSGWHGGHGNYVKIQHNSQLATGYGHMSRFAVKSGQMVKQGQVIGYVGSTGLSTGPHLHYELWRNGQAVDPRSVKFTSHTQLAGKDLRAFRARLNELTAIRSGAKNGMIRSAATGNKGNANG